jgi:adenylate kinase
VVILKPPDFSRGTVCQWTAQDFGLQHLSSSHVLWENVKANMEVGGVVEQYLEKGHMPNDVRAGEQERPTLVTDGFPRTLV